MHVVATAGHVDHGKSTLVRQLTGMEPDRWAEEHRRGLTIDLGYVWTTLPSGTEIVFVDVPGHERFVPNMLAGVGPIPAVLFVVAADAGWMPQSEDHLAALDALQIRHGVVAITRCDLADPSQVVRSVRGRLGESSLARTPIVEVSATTGYGLDRLRAELDSMVAGLPLPEPDRPVRVWIDRSFVAHGAGTVVTGTLTQGTIHVGDQLLVNDASRKVHVRALQTLKRDVPSAPAVARVAVNLRRAAREEVRRGDALLGPGPWHPTSLIDVRTSTLMPSRVPADATFHIGSAAVQVRVRRLTAQILRLALARPVPLAVNDLGLLRRSDQRSVLAGVTVLDTAPPHLVGRGAGRIRGEELENGSMDQRWRTELRRRQFMHQTEIERLGLTPLGDPVAAGWYVDEEIWSDLPGSLEAIVVDWGRQRPLEPGMPVGAACRALGVPTPALVEAVARLARLHIEAGLIRSLDTELPVELQESLARLDEHWIAHPFRAPEKHELQKLHLGPKEIAAAARAGRVLVVERGVVLPPDVEETAVRVLAELPSPFTLSAARQALDTTRRVAVPLLELLDQRGRTVRVTPELRRLAKGYG